MNTNNSQQLSQTQKHIVLKQETSCDGKPLDFSFKGIKSLDELKNLEPKSGKRKDFPKDEEESKDENKKVEAEEDQESKQNENETQSQKDEDGENKEGQENNQNNQRTKEKKEEKKPEQIQPQIIRMVPNNNMNQVITNSQLPTGGQTKAGVKVSGYDESKGNSAKYVVKINLVCSSLILSYNKIGSLMNFKPSIEAVMLGNWNQNLCWIDLSHNHIEKLDYNFSDVPNLKSLYLHCNYISDLKDLLQLGERQELRSLTIHGNVVETIGNFRLYIIGMLPALKKLDSVVVSKKERDNSDVWINMFQNRSIPYVKDPPKPPHENLAQNNQKQ